MLEKNLAEHFTKWCYKHYPVDEKRIVAVKYGIEILLNSGFKLIGLLALAALFGKLWEAFMTIACFALFRTHAGGFHMHSSAGCFAGMCFIVGGSIVLSEIITYLPWPVVFLGITLISLIVNKYAPCSTENNPVIKQELISKKRKNAILTVRLIGICILAIPHMKVKVLLLAPLSFETISILPIRTRKK